MRFRDGAAADSAAPVQGVAGDPAVREEEVRIAADDVELTGDLAIPDRPLGMVIFAHGSGSSRNSPRNRYVARELNRAGLGTLLFDLLTVGEERHRANVFDIEHLARRLVQATRWLACRPEVSGLRIGYFGASTGAAAALCAAAYARVDVSAIVSRGGRPDLAGAALERVSAPTLLIVGGADPVVLDLNRLAAEAMSCETALAVVPDATHLFVEPGALEKVAVVARDWLVAQLAPSTAGPGAGRDGSL